MPRGRFPGKKIVTVKYPEKSGSDAMIAEQLPKVVSTASAV